MRRSLVSAWSERYSGFIRGAVITLAGIFLFFSCRTGSEPLIRTITAETLADKYSVSVDSARREFDGDDLLVEGYVLNLVTMPENDDEEGMVLLGSDKAARRGVECWFTRYESKEFTNVQPGALITVKGTFNGEAGPVLKFCKLVKQDSKGNL